MISWNKVRFIEEDGFDKTPEEMCRRINKFLGIKKFASNIALPVWEDCEKFGRNMHCLVDMLTVVKYNQVKLCNRNDND